MFEKETASSSRQQEDVMKVLQKFWKNESGATAIEYGLIAALISVAIIGGASLVGTGVNDTFTDVSDALQGV
jgi:pilus assembly protein Flp/PilA